MSAPATASPTSWCTSAGRPIGSRISSPVLLCRRERMWGYLHTDSLSQNAEEFSDQALPDVPR